MELYPIFTKDSWGPSCYVIIEVIPIPSMCPEFEPPPPDDFPFPEFWSDSVTVAKVDIHEKKCETIEPEEMRKLYSGVRGRRERIAFWHVLKYMEWEGKSDE